jgi:hypothetical protein
LPDPIESSKAGSQESGKVKLRDWILLPVISLLTICLIAVAVELTARHLFPTPKTNELNCLILNDPSTGVRAVPNSTCVDQTSESKPVVYKYNSCGYRAGMACSLKQPGTFRIVLMGSSFAEGLYVKREQTFAAVLPAELSRDTGRKIELYNEGMHWGTPRSVDLRFNQVVAAQPDMILWALTPFDIQNVSLLLPYIPPSQLLTKEAAAPARAGSSQNFVHRTLAVLTSKSIPELARGAWRRMLEGFGDTRTSFLLQHYLYESPSQYVKHFLMQGDDAEFLRVNPNPQWQKELREFAGYDADLEAKAHAAGIPFVVVLLPDRAQAAMISMGQWPDGYDPYKLSDDLRSIVESHGGTYVDILHGYRTIPNPEQHYLPMDGHIDSVGHHIVADLMAKGLTSGSVPLLSTTAEQRAVLEAGK